MFPYYCVATGREAWMMYTDVHIGSFYVANIGVTG
jgi:hypothetical protein